MNRIKLPIEEIVEKNKSGKISQELGIEYGVSSSLIRKRITEYYEKIEIERPIIKRKRIELPIEEIAEKHKNGMSQKDLATEYEVSCNIINNRLKEYYERTGIDRPRIGFARTIKLPIEEIIERYENRTSLQELAIEYGVSYDLINNRVNEYYKKTGIARPSAIKTRHKRKRIQLSVEEIVEKYQDGSSLRELAEEYKVSHELINKSLKEYYEGKGKGVPKILSSSNIVKEFLKKRMTIEEIIEIASKRNVIIPKHLIEEALKNKNAKGDDER